MAKKPPAPAPSRQELEKRAMEIFRATKARLGDRIEEAARTGHIAPPAAPAKGAPPAKPGIKPGKPNIKPGRKR